MAIIVEQGYPLLAHDARILSMDADGNYTSAEVDYIVRFQSTESGGAQKTGQDIDAENLEEMALVAVRPVAKAKIIGRLKLASVTIKDRPAPCAYVVTANYNTGDDESSSGTGGGGSQQESVAEMSFEASAQMQHITIARKQEVVWVAGGAKDPKFSKGQTLGNRIGWNCKVGDDLAIEGCDTPTGTSVETWTKTMPYSAITTAKKIQWGNAVGKVNRYIWKGWPPRCAMFMGASFQKEVGNRRVQVSFHFAVGGPSEQIEFEGETITVNKSPFDYVWAVSDTNNSQLPYTRAVVLSNVAQEADFSKLGV